MKDTKVFWLIIDSDIGENFIHVENVRLDKELDKKLAIHEGGTLLDIWPTDVSGFIVGSKPVDYLLITPRIRAVSERAKLVIEKHVNPSDVEFLPINILHENSTPFSLSKYWVINVLRCLDALDWENSKWVSELPPKKEDYSENIRIIKPCFCYEKFKNFHLFTYEIAGRNQKNIYVSKLLRQKLLYFGCAKGMEFSPIHIS